MPSGDLKALNAAPDQTTSARQRRDRSGAAIWALLVVYMIAIAAAVAMIFGDAGASQLKLVRGSVGALKGERCT